MLKRKFGDSIRIRNPVTMVNEVLCKVQCHNICAIIMSQCELGIEPVFWPNTEPQGAQDVLPLVRPG